MARPQRDDYAGRIRYERERAERYFREWSPTRAAVGAFVLATGCVLASLTSGIDPATKWTLLSLALACPLLVAGRVGWRKAFQGWYLARVWLGPAKVDRGALLVGMRLSDVKNISADLVRVLYFGDRATWAGEAAKLWHELQYDKSDETPGKVVYFAPRAEAPVGALMVPALTEAFDQLSRVARDPESRDLLVAIRYIALQPVEAATRPYMLEAFGEGLIRTGRLAEKYSGDPTLWAMALQFIEINAEKAVAGDFSFYMRGCFDKVESAMAALERSSLEAAA
jgi:hypothetical protein